MVRKNYYLSGPSFTVNGTEDELTCVFENPRALNQVSVVHAAFTLDLAGPAPPMQLYLRSHELSLVTSSNARELTAAGQEHTTDILGHVTLVNAHDLSSTGHYELQRPVVLNFGTDPRKVAEIDFYLTDHTGARQNFLMEITETIDRYAWGGDYTFGPTGNTVALTLTWGPNVNNYVGGDINFPVGNESTWTFRYDTGVFVLKWQDASNKKVNGVWDKGTQAFTWTDSDPESWGLVFGDPLFTFNDWTNNGQTVLVTTEIISQFPYASIQVATDSAH